MTITEFINQCDYLLKSHFNQIEITGEISEFKPHHNGHWYFTLKDESSSVSAVMFSSYNNAVRFEVGVGVKVAALVKVGFFKARGQFQVQVIRLLPLGAGELEFAFNQLKERLGAEGLFEPSCKKPLPKYPQKVALITSVNSAAFADMQKTISLRWRLCKFVAFNTLVQGPAAPQNLINALQLADSGGFDAIIIARGGGSKEDLWAFNDERLARAIFAAKTPIVTGIGHEIDISIADLVADFKSATPTAAVVNLLPSKEEVEGLLDGFANDIFLKTSHKLKRLEGVLDSLQYKLKARAVNAKVERKIYELNALKSHFQSLIQRHFFAKSTTLSQTRQKLNAGVVNEQILTLKTTLLTLKNDLHRVVKTKFDSAAVSLGELDTGFKVKGEFLNNAGDLIRLYKAGKKVSLDQLQSGDEVVISSTKLSKTAVIQ